MSKEFAGGFIYAKEGTLRKLQDEGYGVFEDRMVWDTETHDRYILDSEGMIHPVHCKNEYVHCGKREFIETETGFEWKGETPQPMEGIMHHLNRP